jgi:hypothetical protein
MSEIRRTRLVVNIGIIASLAMVTLSLGWITALIALALAVMGGASMFLWALEEAGY